MRYAVSYRPPYRATDREVRKQYEELDAASPEAAAAEVERRHPGFEAWEICEIHISWKPVLNLHFRPMHEVHRSMIVNGYFDELADILPEGTNVKIRDEMTRYIHHEKDNAEVPLLHSVRYIVEVVRADEQAKAQARIDLEHDRLRSHYQDMEARIRRTQRHVMDRLRDSIKDAFAVRKTIYAMALTARASGRKTLPARPIIEAVGLDMTDWEDR